MMSIRKKTTSLHNNCVKLKNREIILIKNDTFGISRKEDHIPDVDDNDWQYHEQIFDTDVCDVLCVKIT